MVELKVTIYSITEQQVSFYRLPMQYWPKNHWPDQAFFKHSLQSNCISHSAILRNKYISLPSDLRACVHMKEKWCHKKKEIVLQLVARTTSRDLKPAMGWCTAQWKMLLSCKFELAHLKKKKKEGRTFWESGNFLFRYFCDAFSTTGCVVHHAKIRSQQI